MLRRPRARSDRAPWLAGAGRSLRCPLPIDPKFLKAEELGIRLEIAGGLAIWEAHPVWKHQKAVERIRASIRARPSAPRACVHAAHVYVQFPDGSLKRADIAIYCSEPQEQEDAARLLPEAVIDVVSKGCEAKDLELGPRGPSR